MSQTSQIREDSRRDPDLLQQEIDATRADVGRTLDALQARLSPGQLLDQALGLFKEHGGEMARNAGVAIKRNPIPMVLTGVGLAWLIASQRRATNGPMYEAEMTTDEMEYGMYDAEHDSSTFVETDIGTEREDQAQSPGMREKMKSAASAARDRASRARERMSQRASSLSDSAHRLSGQVSGQARYRAQRTREGFGQLMEEQPLIAGIAALAIGALAGAMLPATRREDELLGETRDRALERAKAVGAQQYGKARETVKHAASEVRHSMHEQQGAQGMQGAPETQAVSEGEPAPNVVGGDGNGTARPATPSGGGYTL